LTIFPEMRQLDVLLDSRTRPKVPFLRLFASRGYPFGTNAPDQFGFMHSDSLKAGLPAVAVSAKEGRTKSHQIAVILKGFRFDFFRL